jgi:uncharacterized protein (DUF1800 family)
MSGVDTNSGRDPAPDLDLRPLDGSLRAQHLLNRVTFGPRPGDLDRLRALGLEAYLDEQLHPERLNDSALEERLKAFPTLSMSTGELIEKYPPRRFAGAQPALAPSTAPDSLRSDSMRSEGADAIPEASMASPLTMPGAPNTPREVIVELGREELLRAVYSRRQLQEVMVQFWMNHFNVFAPKGADKYMLTSFERDTIRPNALGNFEDLLVATARSPAMLFYLDNWMSAVPDAMAQARMARRAANAGPGRTAVLPRGLNENYGRELMELHTLGVDGGYTQQDVIEVARCLTGWTIRGPRKGGSFFFNPHLHDNGAKTVLGHAIAPGGGENDGLQVLHILATHPSTARFISLKLCRRFVSDDPPPALVDRSSREFLEKRGDLRAVLRTILNSPEFYSEGAYRAKIKSPLEMVASTLRALDAETDASPTLLGLMGRMGEPMFQHQSPAGYPDRASTWISSSALLGRLNFATLIASNRIPGTRIALSGGSSGNRSGGGDESTVSPDSPAGLVDELNMRLTGGALRASSRAAILESAQRSSISAPGEAAAVDLRGSYPELTTAAALVIGSPEFQWR